MEGNRKNRVGSSVLGSAVILLVLLLVSGITVASAVASISATKTDALIVDNDGDGDADPGDAIEYTVVIQNTGDTAATNTMFSDTIDANTTISGTFQSSPIARNDSYASLGNVGINVSAGSGVLANDSDPDGGAMTVVAFDVTSANGGTVSVAASGSFTYTPPAGFEGDDTFTYTGQDDEGLSDPATVTISVSDVIWFVDASATCPCDGTLARPFDDLAVTANSFDLNAADEAGDHIFLADGSYNGGLTLLANQTLIGDGSSSTLAAITGVTVPAHSNTLPTFSGTDPVISNASGSGVILGSGNLLRGLTVGNTSTSSGAGMIGSGVGSLEIQEVSTSGTGKALDINGGTLNLSFDSVAVTSSTNGGFSLQSTSGTTTIPTLSLATTGGTGFLATNAGTVNVNSGASSTAVINSSGGTGINVSSSTFNATFTSVAVSNGSGSGVVLSSNSGSINITGSANTVSTTNGVAVDISNTTIGASGVTFQSISASNTDIGISLDTTGSGSFTVTGVSTTDGSGGTLQNLNDHGIELISAQNVSFSNMNLTNATTTQDVAPNTATCDDEAGGTNTGCNAPIQMVNVTNASFTNLTINGSVQHGINGNNVSGLTIANTDIANIGNQNLENGVQFINLLGNVTFDNFNVDGSYTRNVLIENNTGVAIINVTNSTVNNAGEEDGFHLVAGSSSNVTLNVNNSSFVHNHAPQLKAHAEDSSTLDVNITGNTFDGDPAVVGNTGLDLAVRDNANLTFDVGSDATTQTFEPMRGHAINVYASGGGTASGNIVNNWVKGSDQGAGVRVIAMVTDVNGTDPSVVVEIKDNDIDAVTGSGLGGIHLESRDGTTGLAGQANLQATIDSNAVDIDGGAPNAGADSIIQAYIDSGNIMCLNVTDTMGSGHGTSPYAGIGGHVHYIGNPVFGSSMGSGTVTYTGFNTNLGTTWNSNGNSPTVTTSNTGEAYVDGTLPTAGTCTTVASILSDAPPAVAQTVDTSPLVAATKPLDHSGLVLNVFAKQNVSTSPLEKTTDMVIPGGPKVQADLVPYRLNPVPLAADVDVTLGTLDPGQVVTITFQVTVDDPLVPSNTTQICNQGTVTADGAINVNTDDPDVGGVADPTCISAHQVDLQLTKDDGDLTASPGDTITYTLNYTNASTISVSGVVLTETVPANTSFNVGASTTGWSCVPDATSGSTCIFAVGALGTGVNSTVDFAVDVPDALPAGVFQIDNETEIGYDNSHGSDAYPANNQANDSTPLSVTKQCGLQADETYTFNPDGVVISMTIPAGGLGTIDCVDASRVNTAHPSAASNMTDGYYWTIEATNMGATAATGFSISLTLPHQGGTNPTICFFPGALGGDGWDCTGTQSVYGSLVTRQGITHFSDWAIGYDVGPTAVEVVSFEASTSTQTVWVMPLFVFGGFVLGAMMFIRKESQSSKTDSD